MTIPNPPLISSSEDSSSSLLLLHQLLPSCTFIQDDKIYVVVVESHQHVLEHVHYVLRQRAARKQKRQRFHSKAQQQPHHPPSSSSSSSSSDDITASSLSSLSSSWSMIHFDAHPDLACPSSHIPASSCFSPRAVMRRCEETPPFLLLLSKTQQPHIDQSDNVTNANHPLRINNGASHQAGSEAELKSLYEFLDETSSGIAEWILPLVLAADLKQVHWIHPSLLSSLSLSSSSSSWLQIQNGHYQYHVGAWIPSLPSHPDDNSQTTTSDNTMTSTNPIASFLDLPSNAVVKVDFCHSYYVDDNAVVATKELHLPQTLQLTVSDVESFENATTAATAALRLQEQDAHDSPTIPTAWALDICLDYFACRNPFLTDLDAINPALSQALWNATEQTRWFQTATALDRRACYRRPDDDKDVEDDYYNYYVTESCAFREQLIHFLQLLQDELSEETNREHLNSIQHSLALLYESEQVGVACMEAIMDAVVLSSACSNDEHPRINDLIAMAKDAIPNLGMPHHPVSDLEVVSDRIQHVSHALRSRQEQQQLQQQQQPPSSCPQNGRDNGPFMITIARSADDGFTPSEMVESIQQQVLHMVHDLYCGCHRLDASSLRPDDDRNDATDDTSACRFRLLFDYGPWEGSSFEMI